MNKDYSILVVDDSANTLFAISETLRFAGYTVEGAENGKRALEKCSEKAFDLFVIDVIMPEMDGMELLRQLKVLENIYEVIIITGEENLDSAKKAMELGAFGYFGKLEGSDALLTLVSKAIEMVDMKKQRLEHLAVLEKKVADRSVELESMIRLFEYQGRQIDSIINSMGEGILAVDNNQSIVLMNRPMEQIAGLRFADCAGMNFLKAFTSLGFADRLLSLLKTDPMSDAKKNILSVPQKDGSQKYYYVNIQQLFNENGLQTGCVILFLDQTESINAERMRVSFFSIAAHELRTPVSINMNYLALLHRKRDNDDEYSEIIQGMQTANHRLMVLVNQIITLASLSNHFYATNRSLTDINQLIQSKISKLKSEADEKKVSFIVENRLRKTAISIDPYLVKIALSNLLNNAVKFNRRGGSVRIVLEQNPSTSKNLLSIVISDEGEGLSERAKSGLFSSFFQGEDPLTRTQGGMGIGLYLIKKVVELMHGSIEVFSEKSKGSTFTLIVPFHETETV